MPSISHIIAASLLPLGLFAQDELPREAAEALRIGRLLYRSEFASWNASDLFMERFAHKRGPDGGYLSYAHGDSTTCLFFGGSTEPHTVVRFTYDRSMSNSAVSIDSITGPLTAEEQLLWGMRRAALEEIRSKDLFQMYEHMNFNLVPLVDGEKRLVYVISGPTQNGVILLGNDYLIELDRHNKVRSSEKIHQNLIPIEFGKEEGKDMTASMHSHLASTGDLITATDICTLMLYAPGAPMKQHYVISPKYVSIWDCGEGELHVITKKAWDRMAKDQEEKEGK